MKARVKVTGEIIDGSAMVSFNGDDFYLNELEIIQDESSKEYDELDEVYWENLKHQYAGMAMQGMLSNTSLVSILFDATKDHDEMLKEVVICSHEYATELVEKLKNE